MSETHIEEKLEPKLIRFAEDDTHHLIFINMSEFKPIKEFEDEIFGWWGKTYISIKKEKK